MILLQDPDRAEEFGIERGIVSLRSEEGNAQFGSSDSDIPWLVSSARRNGEAHAFTCEFSLDFSGEIVGEEIAALAQRLGLAYRSDPDGHTLVSQSNSRRTVASMRTTELAPCPADSEVELSDEVREAYLRICGRTTFEFNMVSVALPADQR